MNEIYPNRKWGYNIMPTRENISSDYKIIKNCEQSKIYGKCRFHRDNDPVNIDLNDINFGEGYEGFKRLNDIYIQDPNKVKNINKIIILILIFIVIITISFLYFKKGF